MTTACAIHLLVPTDIPLLAAAAVAQEDRPQITPPQSKPGERKIGGKEVGPRALALLQLGANGKASVAA